MNSEKKSEVDYDYEIALLLVGGGSIRAVMQSRKRRSENISAIWIAGGWSLRGKRISDESGATCSAF